MNKLLLLSAVAVANPDGFTVDVENLEPIKSGYAVAVSATQNSFGENGLKSVINYAKDHKEINAFGGWLNSENNMYYFDAVVIFKDIEKARKFAKLNNQIAFFDLNKLEEIRL